MNYSKTWIEIENEWLISNPNRHNKFQMMKELMVIETFSASKPKDKIVSDYYISENCFELRTTRDINISFKNQLGYYAFTIYKHKNTDEWITVTPFATHLSNQCTLCNEDPNNLSVISGSKCVSLEIPELKYLLDKKEMELRLMHTPVFQN